MSIVSTVVKRARAGDKLAFCWDVYGNHWVELTSGFLLRRTCRVEMTRTEIEAIKAELRSNRSSHRRPGAWTRSAVAA